MPRKTFLLAITFAFQTAAQTPAYLILQKGASSLAYYSTDGKLQSTVPTGQHPHEMILSTDGRYLYTTDNGTMRVEHPGSGGNSLSIIDVAARRKFADISLGEYHRPHGIDIDAARFAKRKSHNREVRAFANTMITDHTAVNAQATALAGRLHVTPAANAVSQSLSAGAAQAHTALKRLHGAAFDRAYMEREVAYHQAVLDALDNVLIPTTDNADLKKLLQDVRPAIAAHLAHARQLLTSLGAAR